MILTPVTTIWNNVLGSGSESEAPWPIIIFVRRFGILNSYVYCITNSIGSDILVLFSYTGLILESWPIILDRASMKLKDLRIIIGTRPYSPVRYSGPKTYWNFCTNLGQIDEQRIYSTRSSFIFWVEIFTLCFTQIVITSSSSGMKVTPKKNWLWLADLNFKNQSRRSMRTFYSGS